MNPASRRSKKHDIKHQAVTVILMLYEDKPDEAEVIKLLNSWKQNRKLKQNVVQAIRNQHFTPMKSD